MKIKNVWKQPFRYYHNSDYSWEFLCYGKPDVFYLQREYLEIKV